MSVLVALLPLADAVTEGKKVIFGMLLTGVVFIAVIAIGETSRYVKHRRGGGVH